MSLITRVIPSAFDMVHCSLIFGAVMVIGPISAKEKQMAHKPRIITTGMTGGPLITPKMKPPGADECIELLESMLDSAKRGDMSWLVVIAGGPSDYGVAHVGNNAAQMNLGIDVAKETILKRVKVG